MIKNLMSILILTLCLSHCTTMDLINVGAGVYSGMEKQYITNIEECRNSDMCIGNAE